MNSGLMQDRIFTATERLCWQWCVSEYEDGRNYPASALIRTGMWKQEKILFPRFITVRLQDYTKERRQVGKAVLFEHTDDIGQIVAQESEPVRVNETV